MKPSIIIGGVILLLISAVFLAAYGGFKQEMKKAENREKSHNPLIIESAAGKAEYSLSGSGYPVLIFHGITGGIGQCFGLADMYLPKDKFKIIAASRFGYGAVLKPEKSDPKSQADAFAALLDSLKIKKAAVLGNSAGAAASLQFAINYPDKCSALIMISSNVPTEAKMPPQQAMRMFFGSDFLYWAVIRAFGKSMLAMVGIPQDIAAKMGESEKKGFVDSILMSALPVSKKTDGIINDMYVSNMDMAKGYDYAKLKVPVLLIHAKDDPMGPFSSAEKISKLIPKCDFMALNDGGHLLLGHEEEVRQRAAGFIIKNSEK